MKKINKAFLIALCALTTSFAGVACGGKGDDTSSPAETSSEVSVGSSVQENSSEVVESSEETTSTEEESSTEEVTSSSEEEASSSEEESSSDDIVDIVEVFDVTINQTEGVTIVGATMATEGEAYTFNVAVNTGYQKTDAYAVTAVMAGEAVTLVEDDGDYTIENVTGEIVVTVVGVEKKTFRVTKNEVLGVTYEGADTVVFGENYTFKVNFTNGYKAGENFAVSINGKVITATEAGEYVVENVKSGLVITVEGVEEVQYTATFTSAYEDAVKNTQEGFKYEAESYTFKIELSGKYTQCADAIEVVYKVEGSDEEVAVTADSEGIYTIANPKANITIIVKNVELNQYAVTFMRNAVVKYETTGTAGQALTEDQLNEALAALVGENEEFVAWREDVTAAIMDKTTFSVVTKAKNAFGTLIEGNPLADGDTVTGEYSAAGYETVYVKTGFAKGPFAEIDLSEYETVKFAFKHTKSWVLFSGWSYYLDTRNTWIDVTMERTLSGDWTVTLEAPVNHNYDGGMEVLNPYTVTLTGNTLAEIFATWENETQSADLYVTELRGEKSAFTKVVDSAMSGTTAAENETAPAGFKTVSERTIADADKGSVFADVDVSTYKELRFAFKSNSWMLFGGWAKYVHKPDTWVTVQLVNNFDNSWSVTVAGTSYTLTYSGTTLKEILKDWYNDQGKTFYVTELIGVQGELPKAEPYGVQIVEQALAGSTKVEEMLLPNGFEYAYEYASIPAGTSFADVDISGYSEVKFNMWLDKGYICIVGWGAYAENAGWGKKWVPITLTNNNDGTWTILIEALIAGAGTNPYSYTVSGTKLSEVLGTWFDFVGNASVYITEIRGVAKEVVAPTVWGTLADSSLLTSEYVTLDETEAAPNGFESVYKVKGVLNTDKKSTVDLSNYSEVRFAVKSTKYFLIKGWGVYFKESYTDWANVVMKNNGDGTWEVTVYADVFTGSAVENPYTVTYTGTSIATILAAWETDEQATTYVTEVRGVAKMEK